MRSHRLLRTRTRTLTLTLAVSLACAGVLACAEDDTLESDLDSADEDLLRDADAEPCMAWQITYNLDGSRFAITNTPLGLGNQTNVVAEPYTAADHVGPGEIVLQFRDVDGAPGEWAQVNSYTMALHFAVNASGARVKTDLDGSAGPEQCGVTRGELEDGTIRWMPAALVDYHSVGQILCKGSFCRLAKLPKNKPKKVDETSDQPLGAFVFDADLSSFTMAETVIGKDSQSTTSWTFTGTETGRELVSAPACVCG